MHVEDWLQKLRRQPHFLIIDDSDWSLLYRFLSGKYPYLVDDTLYPIEAFLRAAFSWHFTSDGLHE